MSCVNKQVVEFSKYLFSMLGTVSWGIGALETVCLAGNEQAYGGDIGYIPSMIFFGVRQKEAIWLRMAGVPRIVANGLAGVWKRKIANEPQSYIELEQEPTLTQPNVANKLKKGFDVEKITKKFYSSIPHHLHANAE